MPHDKAPDAFVPSYLLYLLAAASEAASNQFHLVVRNKGLRVPEWRVMACLYDQDGLMITRLAEFSLIEQSRLTRIVSQMDEKGLVARRTGKEDRRKVTVHLSAKGKRIARSLVNEARAHEAAIIDALDDTSAKHLKPALQTLLATLESHSSEIKNEPNFFNAIATVN